MVVNFKSKFNKLIGYLSLLYKNRIRLGMSGYSQLFFYSFLFSYPSFSYASPTGGNIVGGAGSINQSGLTTNINQLSSSLAIDWQSFNVSSNEIVNFLQPNSTSIALNRIIGGSASDIFGQINANGRIVLVNPNGVFFGSGSSVNVGGLIASGLDIKSADFMNGDYVFSSIDGTSGAVINGGILNASLGGRFDNGEYIAGTIGNGNISLLGKQITNTGLISANLGAVNLAAGKVAVLTFDNEGLMGVKITKAILQDELGVDPAILNEGDITAESGRVLLTASQSQDIFSQAVNNNGIDQATSVVVYEDGTFTLGSGADVINTGSIDVSAVSNSAGQIIMLGENISSDGIVNANTSSGNGGEIEIHANDTVLLTGNTEITALSDSNGQGGVVKVLGNKVGLFDQVVVNVSGENGGGQILLGGDIKGENNLIRNAEFLYIDEDVEIEANAIEEGDGGRIIAFSDNTSRIFGSLQAKGGAISGDGGFIETSGKMFIEVTRAANASAENGIGGSWLIDPRNVDIVGAYTTGCAAGQCPDPLASAFSASVDDTEILASVLVQALIDNGTGVTIDSGSSGVAQAGDITIATSINYDGIGNNTLTLNAANDIIFRINNEVGDGDLSTADSLNLNLYAKGAITLNDGVIINTRGGDFTVGYIAPGTDRDLDIIPTSFSSYNSGTGATASIITSGINYTDSADNQTDAGNITITATGAISINSLTTIGGDTGSSTNGGDDRTGRAGGDINIIGSSVVVNAAIDARGNTGRFDSNDDNGGANGGKGGDVNIEASSVDLSVAAITTNGGSAAGDNNDEANGGDAGTINLTVATGNDIILNDNLNAKGAIGYFSGGAGSNGDGADITITGNVNLNNNIIIDSLGYIDGVNANGTDGAIWFKNNITADANSNLRTIELISGLSNTTIDGSVGLGADNALQSLTITSSSNAIVNEITTLNGGINLTASTGINLGGNINTNALTTDGGNVDLNGNVTLSSDVTINTNGSSTSGFVDFSNTVDSDNILRILTIDAGTGAASNTVNFNGTVGAGAGTELQGLLINNASTITAVEITTNITGFKANGIELLLNGDIVTNGGAVDLDSVNDLFIRNNITTSNGDVDATVTAGYFDNDFNNGQISTALGTVTILTNGQDSNGYGAWLGDITTTSGNLNVTTTAGEIYQDTSPVARTLAIGGITALDSGSSDIILTNITNDFTGAVSIITSGAASVVDSDSIVLGTLNLTGTGSLDVTALNGGISQFSTSTISVAGTTFLTSSNGNIIVNNSGNDFTGTMSINNITGGNTVTVGDDNDITLGSTDLSGGTYTVNAGADINLPTSIDPNGSNSTLILNADNDINLTADPLTGAGSLVLTFNSNVDTLPGGEININTANINSNDRAITFNGDTVLQQNTAINAGTAKIDFTGTLDGDGSAARDRSILLTAGDVDFDANVGLNSALSILSDLTINASGDVNAGTNSLTVKSLDVINSNSFTSGNIDTSGSSANSVTTTTAQVIINSDTSINTGDISTFGSNVPVDTAGLAGGNVTLAANNITLGAIDTHGSDASFSAGTPTIVGGIAGDVSIIATELTGPTVVPFITLGGDINVFNGDAVSIGVVQAGATKTAQLSLVSSSTGTLNINHVAAFTSRVNVTGSAGIDTINAADIDNTWDITDIDTGDLNSTLHFDDFENLTGLSGVDTFTFSTSTGTIDGLIDGGTGLDVVTLFSGGAIGTTVQIAGVADQVGNSILEVENIETITGNTSNTATDILLGENVNSNWYINGADSGSVGDTSLLADAGTPVQGVTIFGEFETLTGNISADTFVITSSTVSGITINGGASAAAAQYDTLIGPDIIDTTWTVTSQNGGTLVDKPAVTLSISFDGIENLTAGTGDDTFAFNGGFDVDGSVDAGDGTDDIDLSNLAEVTFNVAAGIGGNRTNFEKVTGNGVNSTLIGDSSGGDAYIWSIEDINAGFVNKGDLDQLEFSGFNNLTGSLGNDTFNFIDDTVTQGDITGLINGGAGGVNALNIYTTGNGKVVTVQLEGVAGVSGVTAGDSNLNGFIDVINLTDITANSNFTSNTLRGGDTANDWNITATRIGTVDTATNFTDFYNLVGGADVDTFNIGQNGVVSDISGGVDAVTDEIVNQQSSVTNWTILSNASGNVTNVSGLTSFSDIELLTGNNDTLTGPSLVANTWNISSDFSGDVNSAISFTGMTLINGGTTADTFNIADAVANGSFSGGAVGTDIFSLDSDAGTNTNINTNLWDITGAGVGTVKGSIQFQLIESLVGNDGADQFTLSTDQFTGSINGGAGLDNLTASAGDNTWVISSADGGVVLDVASSLVASFTFIENLIGNTGNDLFFVSNTGNVSGTIDGGTGIDTLSLTSKTNSVTVNLGVAPITNIANLAANEVFNTDNIETVNAPTVGALISNTIVGADDNQLWIVDGINQGAVADASLIELGIPTGDTEGVTKFTNFDNVIGGTEDDSFRVLDGSSIVTSLSGGAHIFGDTIDLSNQLSVDINIGDGVVGFNDIEGFRGNDTNSTLTAKDVDNVWTIFGNNDGTVLDASAVSFSFFDFNILIGGSAEDQFIVEAGGSVEDINFNNSASGIQGGAGTSIDSLVVEFDGTNSGRVAMFDGEGGNDTVTFRDSGTGSTGFDRAIFTPDVSLAPNGIVTYSFENLSGLNNSFDVLYVNAESLTDDVTANALVINGTAFNDEITLDSTSYTVNATDTIPGPTTFVTVDYTNKTDIEVIAGNGLNDLITLTSNIGTTASDVTLSAETVDNADTFKVAANNLTLDTVRVTSSPLQTNAANLFITNSDITANTIDIVEDDDLALAGLQYTGTLNINTVDDITQSNVLSSSALLNLTSSNGGIDLSNVNNTLSGRLNLLAANGVVDLVNSINTNLGNITATTLNVVSAGSITDTGTLSANSAIFDSGTASIILNTAANDFNQLSVVNANSISVTDINDIQLGDINMGVGIFLLNSIGVTQLGGSSFTQAQPGTGSAGAVTFNAGAAAITLAENNQFAGPVSLNNSGNNTVSITDIDNLVFGNSNVGEGSLTVNAVGISQVAGTSLTQDSDTGFADGTAGDVTLNAGAGSIVLTEAANDFSGFVLINNTGLNDVDITDENKITLGSSSIGGDLRVTAIGDNLPGNERNLGDFEVGAGDIEQDLGGTGITVAGSSVFSVSDSRSIILSATGNNFNSIGFELTGGVGVLDSVLLVNNSAVDLGNMIIGGHIGVLAGGTITNNSGALQVAGTTWVDASNGLGQLFDVQLNNAGNDFNDLIVNAANDVNINDINDINFGDTANLQFNGAAVSDVTTVSGDLTVTSGGNISDLTGVAINVTGDSQFNAITGDVVLDGAVNLNTVGFNTVNVTLVDTDAIDLAASNITNVASFTAQAGNITNSGDLTIAGNSLFSAADTSDISITNITSGNQLSGDLSFVSSGTLNSVTLENTVATNVMALDVNNNLSITSAGELTQGGAFNVGNTTTLNVIDAASTTQNISLSNFINNLSDLFVANANDVTIDNSVNALTISQMNATGIVNILSGALSVVTDITAGGITFNSGSGSASFTGDLTSSSDINVTSTGLTLNGAVNAVNDSVFDASTGNADINNTIDVSAGSLNLLAANINQNANVAALNDVVFDSTGSITTTAPNTTTSTAGNIIYDAVNDVTITTLDAQNGDISVKSTSGRVGANTASANYIGNLLTIESVGGVGSGTGGVNDLNTQVSDMDILNTGSGDIRIQQNGDVDIHQLRNTVVNGLINIGSNDDYRFDPGSVEVDRTSGTLFMTTSGDFLGNGLLDRNNADITAFNATFISLSGNFGITSRPIVLDVPKDGSVLIDTRRTSFIFFPETPDNLISTGIDVSALGVVSAIAGELQVEVESLGDVDPAIFTDLQNYSLEEISIRMPRDQLFEDELEEYDRLQ